MLEQIFYEGGGSLVVRSWFWVVHSDAGADPV